MRRTGFLLLAVVAVTPARAEQPDRAVVEWVMANAVPLKSVEAGSGFGDLQPLKGMVGNARIASLGEPTHGTREVFQVKHRLLELLVEEKGFTAFAIEASFPDCLAINDYVRQGAGDPEKALSGQGFWTWDTEEVLDLIKWMRRYNEDPRHVRKLKFYGFDMQNPSSAAARALAYLEKAEPGITGPVEQPLEALRSKPGRGLLGAKPEERAAVRKGLAELLELFDGRRERLVRATSAEEFELARRCAVVAGQGARLWTPRAEREAEGGPGPSDNFRDHYMAENVAWALGQEGEGGKVVTWAHNWHASRWEPDGRDGAPRMGTYLARRFGKDHVVFGFVFNQGGFQALRRATGDPQAKRGLQAFTVGPAKAGSVDHALAQARLPLFVLDLRRAPEDGPVADWLRSKHPLRTAGAVFQPENEVEHYEPVAPAREYDALVFLETTTRARPTAAVKRRFGID
jgi:erythromycin esterase